MLSKTNIAWTEFSWNPTTGCTKGCSYCYARKLHNKRYEAYLQGAKLPEQYGKPFHQIQLLEERLVDPLRRKKPCRIFVDSMGDLFDLGVPFEFIASVFGVMACADRHTFQILTKQPEWMSEFFKWAAIIGRDYEDSNHFISLIPEEPFKNYHEIWDNIICADLDAPELPLPNVHIGVSAETQDALAERISYLINSPIETRILSLEPLHEEVFLIVPYGQGVGGLIIENIDQVIVGCGSGPGRRPCNLDWIRSIVEQCKINNVACFVKQIEINGRVVHDINLFPEHLQVREFPEESK